jgi:hypothetical protein
MLKVNEKVKEICSSGQGKSGVNRIIPRSEITKRKRFFRKKVETQ